MAPLLLPRRCSNADAFWGQNDRPVLLLQQSALLSTDVRTTLSAVVRVCVRAAGGRQEAQRAARRARVRWL